MEENQNSVGVDTIMGRDQDNDEVRGDDKPVAATAPPLPSEAHGRIGRHLRKVYGDMLAEPMPAKIGKLLDELAKSGGSK